jgi:hypothetical protein
MKNFARTSWIAPLAAVAVAAVILTAVPAAAQDLHPSRRPSPMGMARTMIGDAYVFVVYSRPYERGRDHIFGTEEEGALVPYGQLWRTGANEATQFTTTGDLTVGGQKLPAGTYSVFTTPGPKEWKIHFNSKLGLNGAFGRNPETGELENMYDAANNVVDITAPVTALAEDDKVDQLTISFEDAEGGGKNLVFRWILTEVKVPVSAAMM